MRAISVTVGPLATASANAICLSQTPSAGLLTINGALASGGVATLDTPRRVLITTTANESSRTFTITGTNWSGQAISEVITGPNISTGQSVLDYATVTSIRISGNAAGALTVGTNGVASSPWVHLDEWALPTVAIQCNATGTVNYTVQQTLDSPNSTTASTSVSTMNWLNHSDSNLVNATSTVQGTYTVAPVFARVLLNSGTGSVTARFAQSGVVGL